jgi:hypothetical protein
VERGSCTRVVCETWALEAAVIPAKKLTLSLPTPGLKDYVGWRGEKLSARRISTPSGPQSFALRQPVSMSKDIYGALH